MRLSWSPRALWLALTFTSGIVADPTSSAVGSTFQAKCAALGANLKVPGFTFTSHFSQFVAAGTTVPLVGNDPTCFRPSQVAPVDLCRIAMQIPTSKRSGIVLEAWYPVNFTGRFLSTGNGGLSGCIQYEDVAYGASLGFATVGANNGHNGTSGAPFLNNPDIIEDFVFRSFHSGVLVGKALVPQLYGKTFTKSYYLGCSTGGRQGFKAVQSFIDDFDGVVAGSPAFDWDDLQSWSGSFFTYTGTNTSATFLTLNDWTVVHNAIMAQCDGLDGAMDGILAEPDLCQFKPEVIICAPGETTGCITGIQAETVRKVFSDYTGTQGELLYPRLQPGAELSSFPFFFSGSLFSFTLDWFRFAIFNDPTFNPPTFTIQDAEIAKQKNPFDIDTFHGDLSAFAKKGSKILTYHGLQDQLISSDNSKRYYGLVSQTMSLPPSSLDDFYRFFTISGMGHCGGGPGAWAIGNTAAAFAGADPQHNVLMAMVAWVEKGIAPDTITGTKFVNDTPGGTVAFTRKHCRWPRRNVFIGTGTDFTNENDWTCVL